MAMLEAMSARKAVVMTAVGSVPETLRDGVDGLLVPSRNADALARALDRAVCDDGLRSTLAHNARKTVESRFCTDVTISKLSDLYSAVGAAHRESPGVSQAKGA
jgi:glycosyltransferase involved in cell wall biosynthesis